MCPEAAPSRQHSHHPSPGGLGGFPEHGDARRGAYGPAAAAAGSLQGQMVTGELEVDSGLTGLAEPQPCHHPRVRLLAHGAEALLQQHRARGWVLHHPAQALGVLPALGHPPSPAPALEPLATVRPQLASMAWPQNPATMSRFGAGMRQVWASLYLAWFSC